MNTKTLRKLLKHTTIPTELPSGDSIHLQLLYWIVRMTQPEVCVEIGSQEGHSAVWIAQAMEDNGFGFLTCIDPFIAISCGENRKPMFEDTVKRMGLGHRITLIEGRSWDVSDRAPEEIEFLFIDGDHTKEGILKDIDHYVPKLSPGGIVFFHDYKLSPGVAEAIIETKLLEGFFKFPLPTSTCWTYAVIKP